jgi:hypothetical protein
MRGEFLGVWAETWREIWTPLFDQESVPEDVFCELYRALAPALKAPPSVEELADIIDSPEQSREAFEGTKDQDLAGERGLVSFLEGVSPSSVPPGRTDGWGRPRGSGGSADPSILGRSREGSQSVAVAPVIANRRERAGRVKTAQRRREVLTRPSASE